MPTAFDRSPENCQGSLVHAYSTRMHARSTRMHAYSTRMHARSTKAKMRHGHWIARRGWVVGIMLLLASLTGCRKESAPDASAGASAALPKLVLRDDTKDLLLTWIDAAGDFHVVEAIDKVPSEARDRVRVVVTSAAAGTADLVYVADLRTKGADGAYATSTITRSAWEETGAAKRKARLEALAPMPSQTAPVGSNAPPKQEDFMAIVYGAEWCGACREAERYLKRKGIKVLEKDVDQSPSVQAELRTKLTKAGMPPTSSIPIIDIGGKLLVGFSQPAVDAALKAVGR